MLIQPQKGIIFHRKVAIEIGDVSLKNLLMGLFLIGCFPRDYQERKRHVKALRETAH